MTTYTPGTQRTVLGTPCCATCGQLPRSHHADGRCFSPEELVERLTVYHTTGRWPTSVVHTDGLEEDTL